MGDLYDLGDALKKVGKEGKDWAYDDAINKDRYTIKIINPKIGGDVEKAAKKMGAKNTMMEHTK